MAKGEVVKVSQDGRTFVVDRIGTVVRRWKTSIQGRCRPRSLRFKWMISFIGTVVVILAINIYMYWNINGLVAKVDAVYMSNVNLNDLADAIDRVQQSMTDYLNTKSSEALEEYYRSEQSFQIQYERLNDVTTDNDMLNIEKNIRSMAKNYLEVTEETMQAKRGRNVERYKTCYETASVMYGDINSFIYHLNNERFKRNTTNYKGLMTSLQYMEIISTVILLVVGVTSLGLVLAITNSITKPLDRLAKAANEVAKGNFHMKVQKVHNLDEVGIVSMAFNKMVDSIQEYIKQISLNMEREQQLKEWEFRMESSLKDAQLKYLQAQINPHFLFNSLNAGVQLAMLEGAERTGEFVEKMADFFRYNLKKINQDTTLCEEVKLVDTYFYILNVRYSGEIQFFKQINESLLETKVPSMIIQPLVENAIQHGIKEAPWDGEIVLAISEEEEYITIEVSDNGRGMAKEVIHHILEGGLGKEDSSANSTGIGIRNVIERLQLYYAREEVLSITSQIGEGTTVTIKIPKMGELEEHVPNIVSG